MIILQVLEDMGTEPTITEGTALIIMGVFFAMLYPGIRYKSPLILLVWFFAVIAFVGSIIMGTSFVFFWIVTLICAGAIVLATGVRWAYGANI